MNESMIEFDWWVFLKRLFIPCNHHNQIQKQRSHQQTLSLSFLKKIMFRNKLTKWKAVAFRNLENRNFAAVGFSSVTTGTTPLSFNTSSDKTNNLLRRTFKVGNEMKESL